MSGIICLLFIGAEYTGIFYTSDPNDLSVSLKCARCKGETSVVPHLNFLSADVLSIMCVFTKETFVTDTSISGSNGVLKERNYNSLCII